MLLKCALVSFVASGQQAVLGAGMAAPPRLADGLGKKPEMMVASASQAGDNSIASAQETKNADAPAEPQTSVLEHKSTMSLSSRKPRRRKPRMAGVPAGPQAVVQVANEPGTQAVAQETEKDGAPKAVTPVKPQAVAQEGEKTDISAPAKPQAAAQKTEETDSLASANPAESAQEKTRLAESGGKQYRMAPIHWSSRVSETLGWLNRTSTTQTLNSPSSSASSRTFSHVQTAEINLSSYIMQPYIAQLGGGIGVVSNANRTGSTGSTNSSRNNSLYGHGDVALFSRSRFPFRMALGSTNSRTNSELTNDDTVGKTLNMQQSYRPPTGYSSYRVGYNGSNSNSILHGNSANSLLNGGYTTRLGSEQDQPFNVTAQRTVKTNSLDGLHVNTNTLRAQHTYLPRDSLLSLTTNANLTTTSQQYQAQSSNKAQFLQANTFATWQPESEDLPLFVNGSGNFFRALTTGGGGATVASQTLGGTAGATYVASHNLSYNANGTVTRVSSGATSSLITTQTGNALYRHDPVVFGEATYSWHANGGAKNLTGPRPDRSVFGGVGHTLGGPYALDLFGKAKLRYSVNQSLTGNVDQIEGQRETLFNGGALSWSGSQGEGLSSGVTVSMNDTRTMGNRPAHTQTIGIVLNGQGRSRYSASAYGVTVNADAALVVTRDSNGTKTAPSARGNAAYNKPNVFGVRGLQYNALLNVDVSPKRDVVSTTSVNKPVSYSLSQRLIYRVGMNELRLSGVLAEQNGVKNALLLLQFRAWRTIGN